MSSNTWKHRQSLSRRDWVAGTAVSLLGLESAFCQNSPGQTPLARTTPDTISSGDNSSVSADAGCSLGFSTYGMKNLSTEVALNNLAKIGFDSVELTVRGGWDADSARLGAKRRQALRRSLALHGLQLTSLMEHVFPTDAQQHAISLERLALAADLAHDLSPAAPPIVQTVLGSGEFDQLKTQLVDRLGDWADLAAEQETTIAIKPHRGGVVSDPDSAIWLLNQLGNPPRLRMVYDFSHYAFRNMPMPDTIQKSLPHTVHVAVKDAVQQAGRVVFQLPGAAGTIDYAQLIKQFYQGGYRGDFNCEVSGMVWNAQNYDPLRAARQCYDHLSRAFQVAGVPRRKP